MLLHFLGRNHEPGSETEVDEEREIQLLPQEAFENGLSQVMVCKCLMKLRRAAELDAKNCEARFRLGEAYFGMGNYRQAVEAGHQATRCQRDYHAAEVLLGDAYRKWVQLEDARTWYGRAVQDSRFKDYATHQLEEIDRRSKGP